MFDLSTLKESQRDKIAQEICREIDASEKAKGDLPQRWQRNEDLYHVAPGVTNLNIVEGLQPYTIPLWRPKADRIRAAVFSNLTGVEPYVQVLTLGKDGDNQEDLEIDMMTVLKEADIDVQLSKVILDALNTNNAVLHIKPKSTENGICTEVNWVAPKDMMCYPAAFGSFKEAKTIGHRFWEMRYRAEQRIKSGDWFDVRLDQDDPYQVENTAKSKINKTSPDEYEKDDAPIEFWEVIREMDLGDGYEKYLCTVAKLSMKLMKIEPYPIKNNWYVSVKTDRQGGKVWSNDSVAQSLQGIQLAYSDTTNTLLHGSYQACFPPVVLFGMSLMGKAKKYGPAQIIEAPDDGGRLEVVPITFNPGQLAPLLDKFEQIADSLTGINRLGEGQNLPASTKATAIDALMQSMAEAKDAYTDSIGRSLNDIWELQHEFLQLYFEGYKMYFGDKLIAQSPEEIVDNVRFEVTGQSSSSSPATMLQKLQFAYQIAQNPNSQYDPNKIEEQIMQQLDLPFSVKGMKKDAISAIMQSIQMLEQLGVSADMIAQQMTQEVMTIATQKAIEQAANPVTGPSIPQNEGMGPDTGMFPAAS